MNNIYDKLKLLPTPSYVIDVHRIERNLKILEKLKKESGVKILLAQKAFSCYELYPLISKYIDGTTSSGLFEAKLSAEHFAGENHVFSPAYLPAHFPELLDICGSFVINSKNEWERYKPQLLSKGKEVSLRINPEFSTQEHPIYDPCASLSRFGIKIEDFKPEYFEGIKGFHFHTLCEQGFLPLKQTADKFFSNFGKFIKPMGIKSLNFGGGHHITKDGYDIESLIKFIRQIHKEYDVEVYLEPGEAIALDAGYLVSTVLDVMNVTSKDDTAVENIIILDASAACHMPDVIEMPYTPPIIEPKKGDIKCRLAGNTCLAGDIIGDYGFEKTPSVGEKIIFSDMAIYSMVKNNTFNGIPLPSILLIDGEKIITHKVFEYEDFKRRL